jgi:hypothetical protein
MEAPFGWRNPKKACGRQRMADGGEALNRAVLFWVILDLAV